MTRNLTCIVLMICLGSSAFAQSDAKDAKTKKMMEDAAKSKDAKGVPADLRVKANVNAQAVLIPRVDANRIFGKEIANNYAVIQLTIGNKSSDAALIIHGVYIDYARWALSGTRPNAHSITAPGSRQERADKFQVATEPSQIASAEYRVVRGQLADAQMWSKRNWTVRLLTFAGSLAGAYAFSIREKGFLRGIDAFSGVFVPGVAQVWPDGTQDQINRLSDFGYRANKVVPQQGSEIIVCFFPIDRFLTPGFRQLFLRSPALFFAPMAMLVDKTIEPDVKKALGDGFGMKDTTLDQLRNDLPCYAIAQQLLDDDKPSQAEPDEAKTGKDKAAVVSLEKSNPKVDTCLENFGLKRDAMGISLKSSDKENSDKFRRFLILDYISQMSLNQVKVVVDGVMTLDTTTIAAKIDSVEFDKTESGHSDTDETFWEPGTDGGVRTGKIHGSYLTGGEVKISEEKVRQIDEIKTVADGSSDQVLKFSFKLTKAIPLSTNLNFVVSKPVPGTNAESTSPTMRDSAPFEYQVGLKPSTLSVAKAELDAAQSKLTVTGSGFSGPTLVVTLHPRSGDDVPVPSASIKATDTSLVFDLPADAKASGCWSVRIKTDKQVGPPFEASFAIVPSPKITLATFEANKTVAVTGSDLVDTSACNGKTLSFKLVKKDGTGEEELVVSNPKSNSATKWTFNQPARAGKPAKQGNPGWKATDWNVKVSIGDKDVEGSPVPLTPAK